MSSTTLFATDTARSGCAFTLLPVRRSADGVPMHPFMWHDGYQRLSDAALSPDDETEIINQTEAVAAALDACDASCMESVVPVLERYVTALIDVQKTIDANPGDHYAPQVTNQISIARVATLYNIAIAKFVAACRYHFDVDNHCRARLGEAAALFDHIVQAPYFKPSDRAALSPDNIRAMAALCAAIASELRVAYWQKDVAQAPETFAAAAHHTAYLYATLAALVDGASSVCDREGLLNLAHIKRHYFEGLCHFAMALQPNTMKGESRRRRAVRSFEASLEATLQIMPGLRKQTEEELQTLITQASEFSRLQRKGLIPMASLAANRKRSATHDAPYAAPFVVQLDARAAAMLEGTLPAADHAAEEASAKAELVTLKTETEHQQLTMRPARMTKDERAAAYRYIRAVVEVEAKDAFEPGKVAMVFVVDVNGVETPTATTIRELLFFAVRSSILGPADKIGLVVNDNDAPSVSWFHFAHDLDDLQTALTGLQAAGGFAGARGTSPIEGVVAAQRALEALDASFGKHVFVVSDFTDATKASMERDIATFTAARTASFAPSPATDFTPDRVPVHTFAIGSLGTSWLLAEASRVTDGNHGLWLRDNDASLDGDRLAAFRGWVVGQITAAKRCVGQAPRLVVDSATDVFVHSLDAVGGLTPSALLEPSREVSRALRLPALGAGERSHASVVFAVASDACLADTIPLGTATLTYRSACGAQKTLSAAIANVSSGALADREHYAWLRQLRVSNVKGAVTARHPGVPQPSTTRGGETLQTQNSIVTDASSAVCLTAPEGTAVEVGHDSDVTVGEVEPNAFELNVAHGNVAICTSTFGTATVAIADTYKLQIDPSSFARVSVDSTGLVTFKCVIGSAELHVQGPASRGIEGGKMNLPAPKQTSARRGEPPATPWSISQDGFVGFNPLSQEVQTRLSAIAATDLQACRGVVAAALARVARLVLRRNRPGTLTQSKAGRRCRKFLIMHAIDHAKQMFANSLAYAAGGSAIDPVKEQLDVGAAVSSPLHDHKRTLAAMVAVRDAHGALIRGRPYGTSLAFVSALVKKQITAMLGARERAAIEREAAAAAKQKEAADAERRRRQLLVASHLRQWDFSRKNVINTAEFQTVLFACPARKTPAGQLLEQKWCGFCTLTGDRSVAYTPEQLVTLVCAFTESLDPADFNTLVDALGATVTETATALEATRLSRSIFNLFLRLDRCGSGWLPWMACVRLVRYTFGDKDETMFPRIEAAANAACRRLSEAADAEVTIDNIDAARVTMLAYVDAMTAFFNGVAEGTANRELATLCDHALHGASMPKAISIVVSRERKDAERQHLVEWDLPHVFDGMTDSDVRHVTSPKWKAPENIKALAAPICLLSGLVPLPAPADGTVPRPVDYWQALRNVLRTDAAGFIRHLRDFPVMSISHRQAQIVATSLEEKGFEAAQLLRFSRTLSVLCNWVHLTLRLAFLQQVWEEKPAVDPALVSNTVAQHGHLEALLRVEALPADAVNNDALVVSESAPRYARQFRSVYSPPPAFVSRAATSPYPPIESPRRPPPRMPQSPRALVRPNSAATPDSRTAVTPARPSTARPCTVRPSSAQKRAPSASSAWPENGWEEPVGINADAY